jgi:hypothetical protein
MMMEAARTSETSVDIQLRTRQYIPEDPELQQLHVIIIIIIICLIKYLTVSVVMLLFGIYNNIAFPHTLTSSQGTATAFLALEMF